MNENQNNYSNKKIRAISNTSSLPILVHYILYVGLLEFVRPQILSLMRKSGIITTENFDLFLQYFIIYLIIFPITMLVFYLTGGRKNKIHLKQCIHKPERSTAWITKWLIIAFSVIMIVSTVSLVPLKFLKQITGLNFIGSDDLLFGLSPVATVPNFVVNIVPSIIFAPIFEELLFRGMIFKNNQKLGDLFAVVTSGILFGIWHQQFSHAIFASTVGMFCCYLYLKTKSIFPSMILHFLINGRALIITSITSDIDFNLLKSNPIEGVMDNLFPILLFLCVCLVFGIITITGLVFLIMEISHHKESFRFSKGEFEISNVKKSLVYFSAPITIITYLCYLYSMITLLF